MSMTTPFSERKPPTDDSVVVGHNSFNANDLSTIFEDKLLDMNADLSFSLDFLEDDCRQVGSNLSNSSSSSDRDYLGHEDMNEEQSDHGSCALKRKRRPYVTRLLPQDIRRSYMTMFGNLFNSSPLLLSEFFKTFASKSCAFSKLVAYNGGRRVSRVDLVGPHLIAAYWNILTTLCPDHVITIDNVQIIQRSDQPGCIITSNLLLCATKLFNFTAADVARSLSTIVGDIDMTVNNSTPILTGTLDNVAIKLLNKPSETSIGNINPFSLSISSVAAQPAQVCIKVKFTLYVDTNKRIRRVEFHGTAESKNAATFE